jgi:hypothetical protein
LPERAAFKDRDFLLTAKASPTQPDRALSITIGSPGGHS